MRKMCSMLWKQRERKSIGILISNQKMVAVRARGSCEEGGHCSGQSGASGFYETDSNPGEKAETGFLARGR